MSLQHLYLLSYGRYSLNRSAQDDLALASMKVPFDRGRKGAGVKFRQGDVPLDEAIKKRQLTSSSQLYLILRRNI